MVDLIYTYKLMGTPCFSLKASLICWCVFFKHFFFFFFLSVLLILSVHTLIHVQTYHCGLFIVHLEIGHSLSMGLIYLTRTSHFDLV